MEQDIILDGATENGLKEYLLKLQSEFNAMVRQYSMERKIAIAILGAFITFAGTLCAVMWNVNENMHKIAENIAVVGTIADALKETQLVVSARTDDSIGDIRKQVRELEIAVRVNSERIAQNQVAIDRNEVSIKRGLKSLERVPPPIEVGTEVTDPK